MKSEDNNDSSPANTEKELREERKFADKIHETLNRILDRFLSRHPHEKEIRAFMDDENNLYDEEGKPTEAYKQQIREMEDYVRSNSIDGDIRSILVHDEIDEQMITSIINFVDHRSEIIKEYENSEKIEGEDFDASQFVQDFLNDNASTKDERRQILETMERLAEQDALEALDDEVVRKAFKEIINSDENKNDSESN